MCQACRLEDLRKSSEVQKWWPCKITVLVGKSRETTDFTQPFWSNVGFPVFFFLQLNWTATLSTVFPGFHLEFSSRFQEQPFTYQIGLWIQDGCPIEGFTDALLALLLYSPLIPRWVHIKQGGFGVRSTSHLYPFVGQVTAHFSSVFCTQEMGVAGLAKIQKAIENGHWNSGFTH